MLIDDLLDFVQVPLGEDEPNVTPHVRQNVFQQSIILQKELIRMVNTDKTNLRLTANGFANHGLRNSFRKMQEQNRLRFYP